MTRIWFMIIFHLTPLIGTVHSVESTVQHALFEDSCSAAGVRAELLWLSHKWSMNQWECNLSALIYYVQVLIITQPSAIRKSTLRDIIWSCNALQFLAAFFDDRIWFGANQGYNAEAACSRTVGWGFGTGKRVPQTWHTRRREFVRRSCGEASSMDHTIVVTINRYRGEVPAIDFQVCHTKF